MKTENVWDYPRPAICEPCSASIQVILGGNVIADTRSSYRVLETSHPPTYYIPPEDVDMSRLVRSTRQSWCEWKGRATYFDAAESGVQQIAWCYLDPTETFRAMQGYLSFYASKVDQCKVDGEIVDAQEGDFYGGWITRNIKGPFKGGPGTLGW